MATLLKITHMFSARGRKLEICRLYKVHKNIRINVQTLSVCVSKLPVVTLHFLRLSTNNCAVDTNAKNVFAMVLVNVFTVYR